jgi:phosphatidate cytidylyltransferase
LRGKNPDLLKRIASAAVLVLTVLLVLWRGTWWTFCLLLLLVTLALWEYVQLLRRIHYSPVLLAAIGLGWAVLADFFFDGSAYLRPSIAFILVASLSWHVLRDQTRTPLENWLLPLGGALYIAWSAGHVLLLRALPRGAERLFSVLFITAMVDTGAYFVGRTWGKHVMAARWSPRKTWEGFAGGVAAAAVSGPIVCELAGFGWVHGIALGILLAVVTPFGDLGVSMIKRQVGVKDTSNLIPGHGGVLDRLDSILVAAIVGYYYHLWAIGAAPGM